MAMQVVEDKKGIKDKMQGFHNNGHMAAMKTVNWRHTKAEIMWQKKKVNWAFNETVKAAMGLMRLVSSLCEITFF